MDSVLEAMDRNYNLTFFPFFFLGYEIPTVIVPKIGIVLRHGENTTLTCNVNKPKASQSFFPLVAQRALKSLSWYKEGVLLKSIRYPDPDVPLDTLRPLVLKNLGFRDGGNYTCLLEMVLRNIRNYNVSDSTMVESKYTVD